MNKTTNAVNIPKRATGIDPDPEILQIPEDFRFAQMVYDSHTDATR